MDIYHEKTEAAFGLINKPVSRQDFIDFINSDNPELICAALINFEGKCPPGETKTILSLLKHSDSRIRELSSYFILEYFQKEKTKNIFYNLDYIGFFLGSLADKNPSVCRNISSCIQCFEESSVLLEKLHKIILENDFYKAYWGLYTLEYILTDKKELPENCIAKLTELLRVSSKSNDYQIREKTAAIVRILYNDKKIDLENIKETLSKDPVFYVRNILSF